MRDGDDVGWVCAGNANGPCASFELIIVLIGHILQVSEKSEQNHPYRLKIGFPNIPEIVISTISKEL